MTSTEDNKINGQTNSVNHANEYTDVNIINGDTDILTNGQIDNVNNTNRRISTCVEIMMEPSDADQKKWERNGTIYQILMGLCANVVVLGPAMGFGYSAVAEPAMKAANTDDVQLNDDQANWMTTISAVGTPIGCVLSSVVMRRGRKLTMFVTSVISLAGWLIIYSANGYEMILLGRAISGIATGMASVPTTVYVAEISGVKWRGTMVTWTSIAIAIGILIVYIFGSIFKDDWRMVALMCALFPVAGIALILLVVPESPLWLQNQNRPKEALEIIKKYRGIPKNQSVPEKVLLELQSRPQKKNQNLLKQLTKRSALMPFLIMLGYFFFQQFSGTFVIIYNAVEIMKKSGVTLDPYYGAVLIGAARIIAGLLTAGVSQKYGRRIPSIISGVCMIIFMGILGIYLFLAEKQTMMDKGVVPVICLSMYIFTSTLGFLAVPFAMVGEVYPSKVKDILSGLTVAGGYIFSAIIVKLYPDMLRLMGMHGVFLFYAIISLIGTIFVMLFLPETKGKTLREIEDIFSRKKTSVELQLEDRNGDKFAPTSVGLCRN